MHAPQLTGRGTRMVANDPGPRKSAKEVCSKKNSVDLVRFFYVLSFLVRVAVVAV
jgi:hypothetical protein